MIAKARRNYKPDHGHWATIMVVCVAIIAAMLFVFSSAARFASAAVPRYSTARNER